MPEEVSMPEKTPSTEVVDLNPKPKIIEIEKRKLLIITGALALIFLLALIAAYMLGNSAGSNSQLEKEATTSAKTSETAGVKKGIRGQQIESRSGILVSLEEAEYDASYEKQKEDYLNDKIEDWENYCVEFGGKLVCAKENEVNHKQKLEASISAAKEDDDYLNQSYLNLKVAFQNQKDSPIEYSASKFRLKDSENNQYTAGYAGEDLSVLSLNPKETSKLTISYYVPASEKKFKLVYENVEISFEIP